MQQVVAQELEKLLTAEDVGRILGRHPRSVLTLAREGGISHVRLGRRGVRFRPEDVAEYVQRHAVEAR